MNGMGRYMRSQVDYQRWGQKKDTDFKCGGDRGRAGVEWRKRQRLIINLLLYRRV